MDRVIDGLYISSREESKSALSNGITAVVSIGCTFPVREDIDKLNYLSFPNLLDSPETSILPALIQSCAFIRKHKLKHGILVHCVYGQSRSVSVIVYYLMTECNYSLKSAIDCVKQAREKSGNNICINPGFLSQLYAVSMKATTPSLYNAILSCSYNTVERQNSLVCIDNSTLPAAAALATDSKCSKASKRDKKEVNKYVKCCKCKCDVISKASILSDLSGSKEFLDEYIDGFWLGYTPIHKDSNSRKKKDAIASTANDGKGANVVIDADAHLTITFDSCSGSDGDHSSGTISCSSCGVKLGIWNKNTLAVCDGFLLVDKVTISI